MYFASIFIRSLAQLPEADAVVLKARIVEHKIWGFSTILLKQEYTQIKKYVRYEAAAHILRNGRISQL